MLPASIFTCLKTFQYWHPVEICSFSERLDFFVSGWRIFPFEIKDEKVKELISCLLSLVRVICGIALSLHWASFAVKKQCWPLRKKMLSWASLLLLMYWRGEITWALINASMLLISQECLTNQRCYWLARRLDRLCFVDCKISQDQVFHLR